ncbi:Transmembrane protein (plasmid) [Cupriavidus necator]|uniref:hypothetical protein n=1 Tax=Cupriavidus necator TaxID=106590 RepID=UPI003F73D40A
MDMRDIEQLHAQYVQPPITIDISAGVASTAPHLGYSGTSSAPAKASTPPFPFALRVNPRLLWGLGFVAAAAFMFAIGTSIGKRESRASNEPVQPLQSASDASARTPAGDDQEWPRKRDSVPAAEAAQSTVSPVSAEPVVAPASAASVTVPTEQTRERSPAEPKAETVKRSAAPPAPAPAKAATVPATAKTAQQLPISAAPSRTTASQHANAPTDIKMF